MKLFRYEILKRMNWFAQVSLKKLMISIYLTRFNISILQIVEFDEGFDTEVFFMYVFIAAGAILLLFLGFSFLSSRKHYHFIFMVYFEA